VANGLHFVEVEEEVAVAGEGLELVVGEFTDGDVGECEGVVVAFGELVWCVGFCVD